MIFFPGSLLACDLKIFERRENVEGDGYNYKEYIKIAILLLRCTHVVMIGILYSNRYRNINAIPTVKAGIRILKCISGL